MNININYLQVLTAYLRAVQSLPQISKPPPQQIKEDERQHFGHYVYSHLFCKPLPLLKETNKQAFPTRLQGSQGRWGCKRSRATPGRNWHFCWDCTRNNPAGLGQEQPVLLFNRVTKCRWQQMSSNCSSAAGHLAGSSLIRAALCSGAGTDCPPGPSCSVSLP